MLHSESSERTTNCGDFDADNGLLVGSGAGGRGAEPEPEHAGRRRASREPPSAATASRCHNDRTLTAGLSLQDVDARPASPSTLPSLKRCCRSSGPARCPRRAARAPTRQPWQDLVDGAGNGARPLKRPRDPNPGAPAIHRLNRAEYRNGSPRPAGARPRPRPRPAGRRLRLRLRQHRRRADRLAAARRAVRGGGTARQPPGRRQPDAAAGGRTLRAAGRNRRRGDRGAAPRTSGAASCSGTISRSTPTTRSRCACAGGAPPGCRRLGWTSASTVGGSG